METAIAQLLFIHWIYMTFGLNLYNKWSWRVVVMVEYNKVNNALVLL